MSMPGPTVGRYIKSVNVVDLLSNIFSDKAKLLPHLVLSPYLEDLQTLSK